MHCSTKKYQAYIIVITILVIAFNITIADAQSGYPPPPQSTPALLVVNSKLFLPTISRTKELENSYYIKNTIDFYGLGFDRTEIYALMPGTQWGAAILYFGSPDLVAGQPAVFLYDYSTKLVESQIFSATQAFIQGAWNGFGNDYDSILRIILGTSNWGPYTTNAHGQMWGDLVQDLNNYVISQGYSGQIKIYAGIDIEPEFNRPPSEARNWVNGYIGRTDQLLFNFGTASGCSPTYPPTEPQYQPSITPANCLTEGNPYIWTQEDIYHLSWGAGVEVYPFPEIYTNDRNLNAQQWYRIGLYSKLKHNGSMTFDAVLTQKTACDQLRDPSTGNLPSDCLDAYNDPDEAIVQMQYWKSVEPYQRIDFPLNFKSDMKYYEGYQ